MSSNLANLQKIMPITKIMTSSYHNVCSTAISIITYTKLTQNMINVGYIYNIIYFNRS